MIIILVPFIIISAYFLIDGFIFNRKLNKNSVYVIATIAKVERSKNGRSIDAVFHYKNNTYNVHFKADLRFPRYAGTKFFLRILGDEPTSFEVMYDEVPDCLLGEENMNKYWQQQPDCK